MNWRWIALTAAVAAALVIYGVFVGPSRESENSAARPARLGYYLKDATITDTNASGAARMVIAASVIEQNPADNSVKLQKVRVDYLVRQGKPWTLTADSGFMPVASKTLTFSGNVVLRGQAWDTGTTLNTKSLLLDTEKQIASTRDDVTIQIGKHGTIASKGLRADLKTEKLKLESSHGRFLPN